MNRLALAQQLTRWLNLRSGELPLVLVLGFVILGNSLGQKLSELAAISNFLTGVGAPQFLGVVVVGGAIAILTTGIQSLLVDRFDRITLVRLICLSLGLASVVLRLLFWLGAPPWLSYGLFYLLSEQQLTFFPVMFWILATDIFNFSQSKRLLPQLATWGFVGSLLGIGLAALTPALFARLNLLSEDVLLVNILLYLAMGIGLQLGLKRVRLRPTQPKLEAMGATLTEGWCFVKEVPAFRYLMLAIVGVVICETVVEYHFYQVSTPAIDDPGAYQTFLSLFTLARILGYIAVQSLLTRRVIAAIELKNTFLILPITALFGAAVLVTLPGISGSVVAMALQKLPQYSIDETARKSLQSLVPEERRGRVSLFMDSYLIAAGVVIGAVLVGGAAGMGYVLGVPQPWRAVYLYGPIAAIAALFALWSILQMRQVYDSSLLNWRLKRRQRGRSVLDNLDL